MNVPTPAYGMNMGQMGGDSSYTSGNMMQMPSAPQIPVANGQRMRGMVKSYSDCNGYGFIGGDEVRVCVGKDVFLHQREVTEVTGIARPQVPVGAIVTFTVTINPKGQPQARELRFEDQSFLQMQQLGDAVVPLTVQDNTQGRTVVGENQYAQSGRRFTGFVRSFSQMNGFGFVGGDEISNNFGKDVFLHFRELVGLVNDAKPSLPTGTWLTFTVTLNQKGQPQARDVQFEPSSAMAVQAAYQQACAQGFNQVCPVYQASQAVASMTPGWTNPALLEKQQGGGSPQQKQAEPMSEADAYARVQADIARFQTQVAALREANAKIDEETIRLSKPEDAPRLATVTRRERSRSRSRRRSRTRGPSRTRRSRRKSRSRNRDGNRRDDE